MEWYEYLAIGATLVVVSLVILNLIRRYSALRAVEMVRRKFLPFVHGEIIKVHKLEYIYQMEIAGKFNYMIKVINMNPMHEVIITNSDQVVVNGDIRNWKRSSKPHFVPFVRDFIRIEPKEPNTIKMIVVYPGCHNITKYINESDCYIVKKFQKIDGLYFIKYNELEEFLNIQ